MSVELEEVQPGKWRIKRAILRPARSDLPCPQIISDIMPPTEQVDGRFYTSKRKYRAVGRAHDLVEVGNEKLPPKTRASEDRNIKATRQRSIHTAIQKYKAGVRSS